MKRILIFSYLLFTALSIMADNGKTPLRHHIIIAVDKAGCDGWIGNSEVSNFVHHLLLSKQSVNKKSVRRYYEPGDYVSVVGFRINSNQRDMSVYMMPIKHHGGIMAYQQYTKEQFNRFFLEEWRETVLQPYNVGGSAFSLVSVAKEYALSALKSEGQQVGRTFLVMITDRHYNGNNFYDEMQAYEQKQTEAGGNGILTPQTIFKRCYEVQQYYFCRYISTGNIWAGNYFSPKGYVELYEYLPLQRNFTLSTAINYPTHLKAKLKRDGSYYVEIPMTWCGGKHFTFNRLEVFANSSNKVVYKTPSEAVVLNELSNKSPIINLPADKSVVKIQLRAWLGLTDGFYNATLMSPDEESPIESGREGLNTLLPIEYEDNATILGISIPGFLWPPFVNDQYTAALVWRIFLWILFIGWLIWMGYRMARPEFYKPRADEFSIGYKK